MSETVESGEGQPLEWRHARTGRRSKAVEVAKLPDGGVALRDGKDPDGPMLSFTPAEWVAFVAGLAVGEFDSLLRDREDTDTDKARAAASVATAAACSDSVAPNLEAGEAGTEGVATHSQQTQTPDAIEAGPPLSNSTDTAGGPYVEPPASHMKTWPGCAPL